MEPKSLGELMEELMKRPDTQWGGETLGRGQPNIRKNTGIRPPPPLHADPVINDVLQRAGPGIPEGAKPFSPGLMDQSRAPQHTPPPPPWLQGAPPWATTQQGTPEFDGGSYMPNTGLPLYPWAFPGGPGVEL